MGTTRRPRVTLAHIMALNAAIAGVLALSRLRVSTLASLLLAVAGASFLVLVVAIQLEGVLGLVCPSCRKRTLRRLALPFAVESFYQCTACGARRKRALPFAPLMDVSAPEDLSKYRRKAAAGSWRGYSTPDPGDTSSGRLLRNKRLRHPSPPEAQAAGAGTGIRAPDEGAGPPSLP